MRTWRVSQSQSHTYVYTYIRQLMSACVIIITTFSTKICLNSTETYLICTLSCAIILFVSWYVGGSKASNCVTNQLLSILQMVCNTVMSLIKNSVCPLIDQRPKAVPGHTFNEKGFPHNQASRTIRYTYTTNHRRLNTLSETKYNNIMHMEWASFAFNSFLQSEIGLFIEPLIPPAVLALFISASSQSKRALYWL